MTQLTKEEIDYDRSLCVELSMLVAGDEPVAIVLPKVVDDLFVVLRRPGSRDALAALLMNIDTERRMRFAGLLMTLEMWDGLHLDEQDLEVQCNWHALVACIQYTGGFTRAALETLALVPDEGHRFTVLMSNVIDNGVPAERYVESIRNLSLTECLEYVRPEPADAPWS